MRSRLGLGALFWVSGVLHGCGQSHAPDVGGQNLSSPSLTPDAGAAGTMSELLDRVRRTSESLTRRDCECGQCDVLDRVDTRFWECMVAQSAAAPETFSTYYSALLAHREDVLDCYGRSSCDAIAGGDCVGSGEPVTSNPAPAVVSVAGAVCARE